jgi:type I restriction enzyme S subunit
MAAEWERVCLADAIELISGGTPKTSVSAYWGGNIPWLSVADFNTGHRWVSNADKSITARGLSESATTLLNEGDIIISARGTVGVVAQLAKPMAFNQSCYGIRGKRGVAETDFVYYVLRHAVSEMKQVAHGGVFDTITRDTFRIIEISLPSVPEQRAIAHILGALDDKIELNRRMNETLEAMARALFKSWFVDFDPVRAKAEGRDPGLPKPIADLFPDSFEDSELGETPKGWEVKKLSDLCSTQYGFTASAVDEPIGPKFLRVTDINKRNWVEWGDVPHCKIDEEARASYSLQVGDLVVARMADPGKSAIIEEEIDAVFASYLVRLKPLSLAHSYYVYGFLKSELYIAYAEGAKSGSVQASMNAKVIVDASLVVPSKAVIEGFFRAVFPLRHRLVANVKEAGTLSAIRDTLLPKLISGELRVRDAERIIGNKT